MILQSFERGFWEGCGLKMADVVSSKRFNSLVDKLKNLSKLSTNPRSHLGTAFRAGHLVMGKLLNTKTEKEALKLARETKSEFGHGIEMRPLIQIFGEELIKAAEKCLPDNILKLAHEWRKATADRQLEITKILFEDFISSGQLKDGKELTWEIAYEDIWRNIEANSYNNAKILPKQYGVWNRDCIANCQGKTQMLTAFAKLAGAEVLTVSPILQIKTAIANTRNQVIQMIENDIYGRGIMPDSKFRESMDAHKHVEKYQNSTADESFHICIAIRLRDGRWVTIDPHALNWGVFPETWNLDKVSKLLNKYKEVIPGLQITAHDDGLHKKVLEEKLVTVHELLARSKKLEDAIGGSLDPMSVADVLIETGELDFIMKTFGKKDFLISNFSKETAQYAALMLYLGGDPFDNSIMFGSLMDKQFYQKKLGSILTVYHLFAIDSVKDELNMEGVLLHPVSEFALPDYHIAISALNSLCDRVCGEENKFFLNYSFDQVTLHNALSERIMRFRPSDPKVAIAAAEVLESLPFIHSQTKKKTWR